MKKIITSLIIFIFVLISCNSSNNSNLQTSYNGGITFSLQFNTVNMFPSADTTTIDLTNIEEIINTVRVELSIGTETIISRDFSFTSYGAFITDIPAKQGYKISVYGMDSNGESIFAGTLDKTIDILPGITINAGIITMNYTGNADAFERKEKPPKPVITSYPQYSFSKLIAISGTKEAGTAIIITAGQSIIEIEKDDLTTWSKQFYLSSIGKNSITIIEEKTFSDGAKLDSDPVYISIVWDQQKPTQTTVTDSLIGGKVFSADIKKGTDTYSPINGIMVLRKIGTAFTSSDKPAQGTDYTGTTTIGNAEILGIFTDGIFTDDTLAYNTDYYYGFFTVDMANNYSNITEKLVQHNNNLDYTSTIYKLGITASTIFIGTGTNIKKYNFSFVSTGNIPIGTDTFNVDNNLLIYQKNGNISVTDINNITYWKYTTTKVTGIDLNNTVFGYSTPTSISIVKLDNSNNYVTSITLTADKFDQISIKGDYFTTITQDSQNNNAIIYQYDFNNGTFTKKYKSNYSNNETDPVLCGDTNNLLLITTDKSTNKIQWEKISLTDFTSTTGSFNGEFATCGGNNIAFINSGKLYLVKTEPTISREYLLDTDIEKVSLSKDGNHLIWQSNTGLINMTP